MALFNFKLEKLKIKAFSHPQRSPFESPHEWTAMFNPTTLKRSYKISYACGRQAINSSGRQASYSVSEPSELDVKLLLDGTGVHEMGFYKLARGRSKRNTVAQRVKDFREVTYNYKGKIHQPNFLRVEWGDLRFDCRLKSFDVSYDLFDRDGTPLRATLTVKFIADADDQKRKREENQQSPDLTHTRIVREGDTLPLLSKEIYGSSAHYLGIARFNDLDDFRILTAGRQIHFPPLEQLRPPAETSSHRQRVR